MENRESSQPEEEAMPGAGSMTEEIELLYEECCAHLRRIETDLLDIIEGKAKVDAELVNRMFRSFHSLKGAADYLSHEPLKRLSHQAESVLGEVREGNIALSVAHAETLLSVLSCLRRMIDDLESRTEIDAENEFRNLQAILDQRPQRGAVSLDLLGESAELADSPLPENKVAGHGRRMRALIVEDNFTCRMLLQDLLSEYGDTQVAINGKEGVEAFRLAQQSGRPYDLICMDVRMPEMDGMEAVQQIRQIEESNKVYSTDGVKIFMTTSVKDIKTITNSFKSLCDTYLFKPVHQTQLEEHLRAFGLLGRK